MQKKEKRKKYRQKGHHGIRRNPNDWQKRGNEEEEADQQTEGQERVNECIGDKLESSCHSNQAAIREALSECFEMFGLSKLFCAVV